jgi:hypothetical protein
MPLNVRWSSEYASQEGARLARFGTHYNSTMPLESPSISAHICGRQGFAKKSKASIAYGTEKHETQQQDPEEFDMSMSPSSNWTFPDDNYRTSKEGGSAVTAVEGGCLGFVFECWESLWLSDWGSNREQGPLVLFARSVQSMSALRHYEAHAAKNTIMR